MEDNRQSTTLTPLEQCCKNLIKHGFQAEIVPDIQTAGKRLSEEIRTDAPKNISYGDSLTVQATGVIDQLRAGSEPHFYDGFDPNMSRPERIEVRREGLSADFFFTGINAVSIEGSLFWRDMIGNRIAPVAFGPRRVVLLVGRNKLVDNQEQALLRIKQIAGPRNIARHPGFNTPCAKTGICHDCNSPDRICNSTLILDRCYPKGRILVILIDQDLGL